MSGPPDDDIPGANPEPEPVELITCQCGSTWWEDVREVQATVASLGQRATGMPVQAVAIRNQLRCGTCGTWEPIVRRDAEGDR